MGMLAASTPWRRRELPEHRGLDETGTPAVLFAGCIMDSLFGHVHAATARVLRANGIRLVKAEGQGCCGALHAHAGQHETALDLARRNVRAFSAISGDVPIVVNAAGCGAMLKEYGRLLEGDPLHDQAMAFAARVCDVSEFLVSSGLRTGGPLEIRVAYDPPCHLLHAQRVAEEPEAIIAAIPGIERVSHGDAELCCGSAGSFTFSQPEISNAVLAQKLDALHAADPDVIATGNPGCIMQIGAGLRAAGHEVPVVHPIELLDRSYQQAGLYDV
jgi:glycolate oxidase iron-sulfur subunit